MAQKKVLLLSEKPVIHDEGLMDVGLHQLAGNVKVRILNNMFVCMYAGGLTQSIEWLLSHTYSLIAVLLVNSKLP
jgi:hypothetical protein